MTTSSSKIIPALTMLPLIRHNKLPNILIAGSITHANTFRSTKRCTAYTSYMSYFQQVHSQIIRILNLTVTGRLTEEWATFREQVQKAPSGTFTLNPGTSLASFTIRSRRRSKPYASLPPEPAFPYKQLQRLSEIQNTALMCTAPAIC